jgi:hypothetical protein
MAERSVTVKLKLDVGDVVRGSEEGVAALDRLDQKVREINRTRAKVGIDIDGLTKARVELDLLEKKIKSISGLKIAVPISLPGGSGGGNNNKKNDDAIPGSGGLGSLLNVSPSLAIGIAAAITGASPMIGAAINAALMTGAGLGGLALGVVGQLQSPIVQHAATDFGVQMKSSLVGATRDFQVPIAQSLQILGNSFQGIINSIDFSGLSRQLVPLAAGIAGAFENMNLGQLFKDAEPFIHEFSALLPSVGSALGGFFHEIEHSRGTMEGLRAIMLALVGTINILGHVLGALGNVFDFIVEGGERVGNMFTWIFNFIARIAHDIQAFTGKLGGYARVIGDIFDFLAKGSQKVASFFGFLRQGGDESEHLDKKVSDLTESLNAMGDTIPGVTSSTKDLLDALAAGDTATKPLVEAFSALQTQASSLPMVLTTIASIMGTDVTQSAVTAAGSLDTITADLEGKVFNAMMGAKQATIGFQMSLLTLKDAVDQNGTSLNSHTKAGLQNQLAILSAVQANQQLYQATVASGGAVDQATNVFNDNAKSITDAAIAAGFNSDEVHRLTDQLNQVPGKTRAEIEMSGLQSAIQQLADAITKLAEINGYRADAHLVLHYDTIGNPFKTPGLPWSDTHGQAMGGVVHAASGMLAPRNPGTLVLAGEPQTGGELFMPLRGISRERAMGLAAIAGNAYGFSVAPQGQFVKEGGGGNMSIALNVAVTGGGSTPWERAMTAAVNEGFRTGKIKVFANMVRP